MTQNPCSSNVFSLCHQNVEPSHSTPLGQRLQSSVHDQSKPDYTVYVIRNTQLELVAVLIEAKHTTNSAHKHAIAQVTGYFAAFDITLHLPLVFVLTEKHVDFILYPFQNKRQEALINAAVFTLPLFTGDVPSVTTVQMLVLLAKQAVGDLAPLIDLPEDFTPMSRVVLQRSIATEQQLREELKHKVAELEHQLLTSQLQHVQHEATITQLQQENAEQAEQIAQLRASDH